MGNDQGTGLHCEVRGLILGHYVPLSSEYITPKRRAFSALRGVTTQHSHCYAVPSQMKDSSRSLRHADTRKLGKAAARVNWSYQQAFVS